MERLEPEKPRGNETTAGIVEHARGAAGDGADADSFQSLKRALESADPDERSVAASVLSDEQPAYETLHRALQELGIAPEDGDDEAS